LRDAVVVRNQIDSHKAALSLDDVVDEMAVGLNALARL
jgi:hypothetical protein